MLNDVLHPQSMERRSRYGDNGHFVPLVASQEPDGVREGTPVAIDVKPACGRTVTCKLLMRSVHTILFSHMHLHVSFA